jgi:sugar lactone lactonase YvrE
MPKLISCPTCSAPLDPGADNPLRVRCSYCGNVLSVDPRDGDPEPFAGFADVAPQIAEIVRLARSGQKIHAIKLYREIFDTGLAEAKDAVERLEVGRPVTFGHTTVQTGSLSRTSFGAAAPGWQQTEPVKPGKGAAGCGLVAAVGLVVLIGVGGAVAFSLLGAKPFRPANVPDAPAVPVPAKPVAAPSASAPALAFGSEGIGAGQFEDARSVAVDGQGRIYVGEYTGGRVQVFDPNGRFVTQFMVDTQAVLLDLDVDRKGTVYACQPSRVVKYDGATGEKLGEVPKVSKDHFDYYSGVFIALDGSIYAIGSNSDILHISPSGALLGTIESGKRVGETVDFESVAVAGDGTVYALDMFKCEVFKFAPDGRYVSRWGGRGDGPGQFAAPDDLAVDGRGRVYVSGSMGGIQVFDPSGRYLEKFGENLVFGMAIDDQNNVYACERNKYRVAKYARGNG